jgi:hypothetical protein
MDAYKRKRIKKVMYQDNPLGFQTDDNKERFKLKPDADVYSSLTTYNKPAISNICTNVLSFLNACVFITVRCHKKLKLVSFFLNAQPHTGYSKLSRLGVQCTVRYCPDL